MQIFVDADACPVVNIVEKIAVNKSIVNNGFIKLHKIPSIESLYLAVKFFLINCLSRKCSLVFLLIISLNITSTQKFIN